MKNGDAYQRLNAGIIDCDGIIRMIKDKNDFARIILELEVEDMHEDGKENALCLKRRL